MTETDERAVAQLMHRAVPTAPKADLQLIRSAMARGARLRHRRVAMQLVSTVAICALTAALATAVLVGTKPGSAGLRAGHRDQAGPTAQSSPTPQTRRSRTRVGVPLTEASILRTLRGMLAKRATLTKRDGYTSPGSIGVNLVYDDGAGAVQMIVSVDYSPQSGTTGLGCDISTCTTRPDGSVLVRYQGSDHPGQPNLQPRQWSVALRHRGGRTVTLAEWNARTEKSPDAVTRNHPPLSVAELTRLVSSPKWGSLDAPK